MSHTKSPPENLALLTLLTKVAVPTVNTAANTAVRTELAAAGKTTGDPLAFVRQHDLRDLVERLDQALETLELCDINEDDIAAIRGVERAIEAAAAYLAALHLANVS